MKGSIELLKVPEEFSNARIIPLDYSLVDKSPRDRGGHPFSTTLCLSDP